MNAMNGVLHSPKELMPFCETSASKKCLKLSKLREKSDCGVKQESTDDFKDYAETTMNELLGWYGYEKLDTRDTKDLNLRHFTGNNKRKEFQQRMASKTSRSSSSSVSSNKSKESSINREESRSALSPFSGSDGGGGVGTTTADSTGVCRSASPTKIITTNTESNSDNGMENKDCCEDNQNIPPGCIVCAWCSKVGMKLFTLRTPTGCKAFCSELCFTQCRRASFKKNKICDWCKHVRHTVNYVDFQDGEQQLQFCSNKCLNQYKMNIFCNETKAHLHLNPNLIKDSSKLSSISKTSKLITPELWLKDSKNGENDFNSANSLKGSSDSELELDLEESLQQKASIHPQIKRKFSEFSKDVNELKPNERQKDNPIKEKSIKDLKRIKHSNKLSNNSSRQTPGAKHSKHLSSDLVQQNEWSSRESNDKTPNFHSPSYRPLGRHSPIPPSVAPIRSSVAPNNNIPLLNGHSVNPGIRPNNPLNPLIASGSPPDQMFPRLPGSIGRGAPLMPSQHFGPRVPAMPNLLGAAQMEVLARMQSSFAGLRPTLLPPFGPPPPHTGFPFPGLPHINGVQQTNGSPLIQPPIQTNGSLPTHMFQNFSFLPPITVMTPYPVPIPIPIPIPVPFLFPVDKELISRTKSDSNLNNNQNISSSNDVTTSTNNSLTNMSSSTSSKMESVISKLVEKKTKANGIQNIISIEKSLDLRRVIKDENPVIDSSDNSCESLPQDLVVNRDRRSIDLTVCSGYRVP